ncbi:MSHA biogenesis protein MshM [Thermosulfidibacter takaii ABI70S6]|uniref:MSHA biogenesis protein MshM n=1 Tax=Thermosulfidibacter takaii (strain DSM 17441 / JCM 13301 / NBRC 103674 / ABI70S6) TaxID=1298851 RepID=A0A0S3QS91_THET7|nr:AAA family ATPase [Thermosulfidibacter takaii]BAT71181.1 MSHA biogenesis protein MshM [Thermosulfidibacter takaii ABI70S6]
MIVTKYYETLNLNKNPFSLAPDLSMFFLMQSHKEAIDTVVFALDNDVPMARIYGEPGMGKTMLLRYIETRLPQERNVNCRYVPFNPMMDNFSFFKSLFSVEPEGFDDVSLRKALANILENGDFVLLIDEAQDMQMHHFTLIKHMVDESNANYYGGRLFVVCAGTLKLRQAFEKEGLKPLAQRSPYFYQLSGLQKDELGAYIDFRLRQTGYTGELPFTRWALGRIWKVTKGNPRKVNILAERSLLAALVKGKRRVGRGQVKAAEKDLPDGI